MNLSSSSKRSRGSLSRQESFHELEDLACRLAPKVEGRIVVATDEVGYCSEMTKGFKCVQFASFSHMLCQNIINPLIYWLLIGRFWDEYQCLDYFRFTETLLFFLPFMTTVLPQILEELSLKRANHSVSVIEEEDEPQTPLTPKNAPTPLN